ncbi:MAG TPA: ATP synthase F1 subunit delta [Verrucomicrobiae bacterium]|nr:ATP synthase F1 subunit delta [Verrucomicrobiae bacterium]
MARDPINVGYAQALLDMAQAEDVLPRIEEESFRLSGLLKSNPNLLEFLKDPNVTREGKRHALSELFQGRLHSLVLNLFIILSDNDRTNRLPQIIEEFISLAAASRQQVTGEIISAIELDEATLGRLAAELSRITGKHVQLLQKVDPSILGGAIIKVGEQIIDASLRRKLEQIKEALAQ